MTDADDGTYDERLSVHVNKQWSSLAGMGDDGSDDQSRDKNTLSSCLYMLLTWWLVISRSSQDHPVHEHVISCPMSPDSSNQNTCGWTCNGKTKKISVTRLSLGRYNKTAKADQTDWQTDTSMTSTNQTDRQTWGGGQFRTACSFQQPAKVSQTDWQTDSCWHRFHSLMQQNQSNVCPDTRPWNSVLPTFHPYHISKVFQC